ncbi:MAG: hypothetical protein MI717_06900 [Spirochaetales bacterium]|nr:hypothetical protein [Spirochaetales bacterium]
MQTPEDYSYEIYEKTLSVLNSRAALPDYDRAVFEAEYEALTVYQGHGWGGRNVYKEAEIEGQIDAYQAFFLRHPTENTPDRHP